MEDNCVDLEKGVFNRFLILQPPSVPSKLPSTMLVANTWHSQLSIHLIPGGRYLVVADAQFVRLLDLGVPGKVPSSPPIEIAKVAFGPLDEPAQQVRLLAWEHQSDRLEVAVGIVTQDDHL